MHDALEAGRRELAGQQMRVGVAGEQHHLEEQHAGGPYRGAAAEPRQDQARDQRLHQEQQERRQENRRRVDQTRFASSEASPVYFAGVSASRRFFASGGMARPRMNLANAPRSS